MVRYLKQHKRLNWFGYFTAFIFSVLIFSSASFSQNRSVVEKKELAPGVVYEKFVNAHDSLSANVLIIDMKKGNYILGARKANDSLKAREKTSSMAARSGSAGFVVLAAMNADFFNIHTGENENNMIINGTFEKGVNTTDSPYDTYSNPHSQFAITYSGKPYIERFKFSGTVIWDDGSTASLGRINSGADSNSITLYNHYQGKLTPSAPAGWQVTEIELKPSGKNGDTLFFKENGELLTGGNSPIPSSGYVLSLNNQASNLYSNELGDGKTIKVVAHVLPYVKNIRTLLGGWPRLIKDGKNIAGLADSLEGTFPRFSAVKHPRSGIGFSKDSTIIYWATIDGRQESMSGMSLTEFANFMQSLGAYQAMNFDGGGSTTMVIEGKVVNSPSDKTGERKVGNCILLLEKK